MLFFLLRSLLIVSCSFCNVLAKSKTEKSEQQSQTFMYCATFTLIVVIVVLIISVICVGFFIFIVIYRKRHGPQANPFHSNSSVVDRNLGYEACAGNEYCRLNELTPGLEPDHIAANDFRHEGPLEMQLPGTITLENRINKSGTTTTDKAPGSSEFAKSHSAHVEFDPNQFIVKDIGPGIETVTDPKGNAFAPQPTGNADNYPGKINFGQP